MLLYMELSVSSLAKALYITFSLGNGATFFRGFPLRTRAGWWFLLGWGAFDPLGKGLGLGGSYTVKGIFLIAGLLL
jgi:hypothetical protein